MQFSVYLFDFDGTLCDTRVSLIPVFRAGFAAAGREVTEEECERWMHLNLYQSLVDSGIPEEDYQKVVDAIITSLDMPESIALIRPYQEMVDVLTKLHQSGKRLGIVSNNTSTHIRLVLDTLDIHIPFDCIVGSDMFTHGKPSAEPIETALEILGEQKGKHVVYVGDSLQDPECGHNAGIAGTLVDREGKEKDYVGVKIASLDELL